MLGEILERFFQKKPDDISVSIDRSDPWLMVHINVNNRRRARIQCVIESDTDILIGDILHDYEIADFNRGYGTLMMEQLLVFARENHFHYIHGNLSTVDLDHKERLHHFYQKFGFVVTEYPEVHGNNYGIIEMSLD